MRAKQRALLAGRDVFRGIGLKLPCPKLWSGAFLAQLRDRLRATEKKKGADNDFNALHVTSPLPGHRTV